MDEWIIANAFYRVILRSGKHDFPTLEAASDYYDAFDGDKGLVMVGPDGRVIEIVDASVSE